MKFMQRSLMGLFLLALTLGLLGLAAGSVRSSLKVRWAEETKTRPARERVFAVNVIVAGHQTIAPKIVTFGEVRSYRTLDLRAPRGGTIIELSEHFVEGGRVAKGDLLVRLDPVDAQSALDVAITETAETVAELTEAEAALILANDEVDAARAQADLRQAALARQQNLLSRGVGTEATVETAALAVASANQVILGKRQARAVANARINRAKTAKARQAIRLSEAKRGLQDTEVFAGFDGVLSTVSLVTGGLVSTNEKIARLIDPSALEIVFRISNSQFARLIAANDGVVKGEITARLEVLGADVEAAGHIERVSAEVGDGQTGRQVFARLPAKAAANFRPGDFVSVEVAEPPLEQVIVLPATAVDAAGKVLVIGENDRLEELSVTVLRKQGDLVIVRSRQLLGRDVVEARSPLLGAGIRVKPLNENGSTKTEQTPSGPLMIELSEERRAKLIAAIEGSKRLPKDRKAGILTRLKKDKVSEEMVNRIEARMGG